MRLDGESRIALTEQEYEGLIASRRQLGAHVARVRITRDALLDLIEVTESLGAALAAQHARTGDCACAPDAGTRSAVESLLGEAQRRVDKARRLAGGRTARAPRSREGR
ncbi:hypothetical protein ACFXPV_18350 [Streptomyces sp. NPDC059118]|uniref:hypothetical protein n=1 Tax=unclassified Streptomyces TaxID=2593676 RepID=UPI0036B6A798